ncbi:MAG: hypothetical protein A3K09_08160 [Nitrospinae bacterium RIFCSPLOWO2_12_FULL_47_7]|nr:MAG: hypothetical protein A3K09_08160 [Nitrospinae bacterium RIFCSPLOWO2_12_FULL_47_7]
MIYQTLKYCLARVGLSMILLMTLGFSVLYYVHEIAMWEMVADDTLIQWGLLIVCVSIGFFVPGYIAERRLLRAIHKLKNIKLEGDEERNLGLFEKLFSLTYSSYFLPAQGEWFRWRLIPCYADYLMAIGREDADAVKVYLKAFLQDPQDSKFRTLLLANLEHGQNLTDDEIDLLIVMLKQSSRPMDSAASGSKQSDSSNLSPASSWGEDNNDVDITNYLASVFLKKQEFTLRSEPLFLKALENKSEDSEKIVRFIVPFLLKKERSDRVALKFYLQALPYYLPFQEEMRKIIGRAYSEDRWRATDAGLHEQCGEVFSALDMARQEAIARSVNEKELSAKLQKVEFFSREDKIVLKKIKEHLFITPPKIGRTKESVWPLVQSAKKVFYAFIDMVMIIRLQSPRFKYTVVCLLLVLVSAGFGFQYLKGRRTPLSLPPPVVEKIPQEVAPNNTGRFYTVQLAAVISQNQANRIKERIQEKGVKDLYVVESKRSSGGSWYKIRAGNFKRKEEAQRFADELMENKVIKNYFVISIAKQNGHKD